MTTFNARGNYQLPDVAGEEEAETFQNGKIDNFVHAILQSNDFSGYRSRDPIKYLNLVAFHIQSNSKSDFERVKRAHDFVIAYLTYDVKMAQRVERGSGAARVKNQDIPTVVRTRFAISQGYANIFKALCDGMGIASEVVVGYTRGWDFSSFKKKEYTQRLGHAWNIVQIDECWYIVDTSWDAGRLVSVKPLVYEKTYSTDWLFVSPHQAIYTHLPYNLNHELLEYLIRPEDFTLLPYQTPAFFEQVVQLTPPLIKINDVEGRTLSLSYILREKRDLEFFIFDKTGKKDLSKDLKYFEKNQTKRSSTQFYFNKKGNYILRIYARANLFAGNEYIAEYGLNVR